jgi:hypothetical protein
MGTGFPRPKNEDESTRVAIDARLLSIACTASARFWWASDIEYQVTPYPLGKPEKSNLAP